MAAVKQIIIDNIKEVCRIKKIKNVDIAEYMGVSAGSVSNWLNGTNFLDVDNLYTLCQFLGVSLNQVFGVDPIFYDTMTDEENQLLLSFRNADSTTKSIIKKILDIPEKNAVEQASLKQDTISERMA